MAAPTAPARPSRSKHIRRLIAGLVVILAVIFIAQNRDDTRVNLFSLELSGPLWLTLTLMTLTGIVIGRLATRRQ